MIKPSDVFEPSPALLAMVNAWEVAIDAYLMAGNNLKKANPGQPRSITIYADSLIYFVKGNTAVQKMMQQYCPSEFEPPFKQGDQKLMQLLSERYSPAWRFDIRYQGQNNLSCICLTEK